MSAYESMVNSLYQVAGWSKEGVLQEVLEWLDENFYDSTDDLPVQSHYEFKDNMIQSFKERFNME